MTDAKPGRCPFCGSEDSVGVGIKPKTILRHGYCLSCGSDGPLCDTPAEAIAAWNAPTERIAELEEAIDAAQIEIGRLTVLAVGRVDEEVCDYKTGTTIPQQEGRE